MIKTNIELIKRIKKNRIYITCLFPTTLLFLFITIINKSSVLLTMSMLTSFLCIMAFIEYNRDIIRYEIRGGSKDEL